MNGRRILSGIYFAVAILLTVLPGLLILPPQIYFAGHLTDLTLGLPILAIVAVAGGIHLSRFAAPTIRQRAAWILGIAAVSAFGAGQLIGFDTYCRQHSFTFCESIEPPISDTLTKMFGADGDAAEGIAIFQMWTAYCFGLAFFLSALSWLFVWLKARNAHLQNLS